jgi:hypothetical protein
LRTINCFFSTACQWVTILGFLLVLMSPCHAKEGVYIPELLAPWVDWVMHDKKEQVECVPQYNNGDRVLCVWPSELTMVLNHQGGNFSQSVLVHNKSWVALPGNGLQWPNKVQVDGTPWVIVQKNQRPGIELAPGSHRVTGRFTWPRLPENVQIPPESGLVSLTVNGGKIQFPNLDSSGRLWLKRVEAEEKIENRLKIESFRLIKDTIPCEVLLYFTLDVAGVAREITLGPLYAPAKFTPLSLKSPLPARIEQDGRLRIQVRPGKFKIGLGLRHIGVLNKLSFLSFENDNWPGQEIWSFAAQPDLRLVEIEGTSPIDPLQTSMPKGWHQYPAYRLSSGKFLGFKEIKRGDPRPAPDQLSLERSLWLRFDGSGYTIQDTIKGKKNTNWRLEMDTDIILGRVAVEGVEQLITQSLGSDRAGVELRNGLVNLVADSLYQGNISALPATGWDHDFQQVRGRLFLPPGWKLLNATGIDKIPHTWIKQWTLLDFFIVLIFTIALAKLFSTSLAGVAFVTLVLTYHEPGAPLYVWLALLIGFALLKYLPDGRFKKTMNFYQAVVMICLVAIVVPYTVNALRIGMYPQLERPWTSMSNAEQRSLPLKMDRVREMASQSMETKSVARLAKTMNQKKQTVLTAQLSDKRSSYYGSSVMQHDPKALTQTGPGMPQWLAFETISFGWAGPVTRDQTVSFTLIGPKINLVLSFVRVALILLLALGMLTSFYRSKEGGGYSMKSLKIFSFLVLFLLSPGLGQTTEIPSQQLLDELTQRLLEKADCFPNCADISDIHIGIDQDLLSLDIQIDAALASAIPLPGHADYWLPDKVSIDNIPAQGILREGDNLWVKVTKGKHLLTLAGPIRNQNLLQLPFPLKPHRVSVTAEGWSVEGLHDGKVDDQLQFKRIIKEDNKQQEVLENGILPPFVRIERTLLFGLVWKVRTKIHRLSPVGSGVVLDIPLIPGESITTQGIRVNQGIAKITLGADQRDLGWESFLEPADQIRLVHKQTASWTEIWKVDISPIFHLAYEGIPVILHKTGTRWYPTWHPWPEETVTLKISRPAGIAGQTLTIEKTHLKLRPGHKTTAASLALSIKSSRGGQHPLILPPTAKLQEVRIMGKLAPIRQEGQQVMLPIIPGQQKMTLKWIESTPMTSRYQSCRVDLGGKSVNASVDIYLPSDRWPLFVGGEQLVGPAILFWSVIIMIFLGALVLSKTGWAKLKFYQWFLLGIGMSMSNLVACLIVVGWLIALDRKNKVTHLDGIGFNLVQTGLAFLTLAALGALVFAISNGLLGHPDMNIMGNGSTSSLLRWYQDVSGPVLPQAWVFSIPMLAYRIAMLSWALWLSFWLVGILKWGWQQFMLPTIWYRLPPRIKRSVKKKSNRVEKEKETSDGA